MSDELRARGDALRVPEFKSTIPEHFVSKLEDQERYIVQTLSKMEQENAWMTATLIEAHTYVVEHGSRLQKIEQWKERLSSKWALVLGGLALVMPVLLKAFFDYFLRQKTP